MAARRIQDPSRVNTHHQKLSGKIIIILIFYNYEYYGFSYRFSSVKAKNI